MWLYFRFLFDNSLCFMPIPSLWERANVFSGPLYFCCFCRGGQVKRSARLLCLFYEVRSDRPLMLRALFGGDYEYLSVRLCGRLGSVSTDHSCFWIWAAAVHVIWVTQMSRWGGAELWNATMIGLRTSCDHKVEVENQIHKGSQSITYSFHLNTCFVFLDKSKWKTVC